MRDRLIKLYGNNAGVLEYQNNRIKKLEQIYKEHFGFNNLSFFSTPGRTELGGNHTDHNNGRVLASSINLDSLAAAVKNDSQIVRIISEGFEEMFEVDLRNLQVVEEEKESTNSLIRGMAARFADLGLNIGGFNAVITSDVLRGSGLSSSASIEVLIGTIFNYLFNDGKIAAEEIAKAGQFAENKFFGKPCGLMDQMACACGGIIAIDFKDNNIPIIEKIEFDFEKQNYNLIVVDTGGGHADLTDDYAAIPKEMKETAELLDANLMREVELDSLLKGIPELRKKVGDRAVLRSLHFLEENLRVSKQSEALLKNDFKTFLELIKDSGNSSYKYLQNIFTTKNTSEQPVSLALAITELFINGIGEGACRVHGGGFAGTILVFLPEDKVKEYKEFVQPVFGDNSVTVLSIRQTGTTKI
ncbi:MAG: hypothetical protein JEY94_01280 [Melioribacteraceae bacterium]|nr:hypothetical protein [Melioribacteraceae bacterium]